MDGVGSSPNQSSGSFVTPLLISMAGIVLTSLALLAYHFFVVRYCLRRRLRSSMDSAASQTLPNPQIANGVEEKVLSAIPILSYSTKDRDNNFFRVDQTECVVCLGELEDGDMVRLLPNCRHAFHVPCVDNWFQGHSSCPICRSPVDESASGTPAVVVPVCDVHDTDEVAENLPNHHFLGQHGGSLTNAGNASDYSSGVGSARLLRHSVSSVLPMEAKPQLSIAALKRSLSMDQYYVLVNLQNENKKEESSSSTSSQSGNLLMGSRLYRARSMKQLDRMSSRLMTSFSQLRMGRLRSTATEILPTEMV